MTKDATTGAAIGLLTNYLGSVHTCTPTQDVLLAVLGYSILPKAACVDYTLTIL
jgi:hypothetical protein